MGTWVHPRVPNRITLIVLIQKMWKSVKLTANGCKIHLCNSFASQQTPKNHAQTSFFKNWAQATNICKWCAFSPARTWWYCITACKHKCANFKKLTKFSTPKFSKKILFGSPGSRLVSWLPLPYIGIAKYSDKCDSVITAEIKLENC